MEHDDIFEHYKQIVAMHDGVEINGAKTPYTAINGNMFSFIDEKPRLCLRFSEPRKKEFNLAHGTTDVVQYGAVMRGYVVVPDTIAGDTRKLAILFTESMKFAESLEPKPTNKKQK